VLVFLISLIVGLCTGVSMAGAAAQWLGIVALQGLFFFSLASLVAQLTGSLVILPLAYGALNFVAVAMEMVFRELLSLFVFGMDSWSASSPALLWCSPVVKLLSDCQVDYLYQEYLDAQGNWYNVTVGVDFSGWGILGVYAVAGLLLAALALVLYRKRRMETAGDTVAWQVLKPVFLVCMAVGCGLLLAALISSLTGARTAWVLALFTAMGAFVGWFAGEMLVKKSFRVFRLRGFVGFAVVAVCLGGLLLAWDADLFGYERRVPDPEDVAEVTVYCDGIDATLQEDEGLALTQELHNLVLENRALARKGGSGAAAMTVADWDEVDYYNLSIELHYRLKNGDTLSRSYYFPYLLEEQVLPEDSLGGVAMELMNCQEARIGRMRSSIPVTEDTVAYAYVEYRLVQEDTWMTANLTPEEALELYETCLLPELDEGTLGRVWLFGGEEYDSTVTQTEVTIELRQYSNGRDKRPVEDQIHFVVNLEAEKTCAWLAERGIPLDSLAEYYAYWETHSVQEDGTVLASSSDLPA
jgi:ABC-2 type transport system permease protein